jgi:O-methyltransferase
MTSQVQRIISKILNKFGVVIFRKKDNYAWVDTTQYYKMKKGKYIEPKPGYSYIPDYFLSTRHKQVDIRTLPEFGELARRVIEQGRTLLGYDRLYTIYQSLQAVQRLLVAGQSVNFAEVGVFKGGTSRFIALCAASMSLNARLNSFDTFEGHAEVDIKTDADRAEIHTPGAFNETDFAQVSNYLKDYSNISLYKGRFQDTCSSVESEKFHFVHSDVDLYEPTRFILEFMATRLVSKGVIVVDDYGNSNCPGVIQAVEEFLKHNKNFIRIALLTGQCMLIKD